MKKVSGAEDAFPGFFHGIQKTVVYFPLIGES